jgi:hypothetical protein
MRMICCLWLATALASCGGGGASGPDLGSLVLLSSLGSRSYGIALDGAGHAFVNDDYGVTAVSIGNGADAAVVGVFESQPRVAAQSRATIVSGTTLYSAHGSRVDIIDVGTPSAMSSLGQISGSGLIWGLSLVGNLLYLADETAGVWAYDVSNPAAPQLVGTVVPGTAYGVVATSSNVYVAGTFGLTTVAISGGAYQVGSTMGSTVRDVEVVGGFAYLSGDFSLLGFDVRDPLDPKPLTLSGGGFGGNLMGLSKAGNRLYLAGMSGYVAAFDVGDAGNLKAAGQISPTPPAWDGTADDRFAYVATNEMFLIYGPQP